MKISSLKIQIHLLKIYRYLSLNILKKSRKENRLEVPRLHIVHKKICPSYKLLDHAHQNITLPFIFLDVSQQFSHSLGAQLNSYCILQAYLGWTLLKLRLSWNISWKNLLENLDCTLCIEKSAHPINFQSMHTKISPCHLAFQMSAPTNISFLGSLVELRPIFTSLIWVGHC